MTLPITIETDPLLFGKLAEARKGPEMLRPTSEDSTNRSRGQKRFSMRIFLIKRISKLQDQSFGVLAMPLCCFAILRALVKPRSWVKNWTEPILTVARTLVRACVVSSGRAD